jgi:hypothetical protein
MNFLIDVHTVLATPEDLDDWHDDPDDAAEYLNLMLHHVADLCSEDTSSTRFEQLSQKIWDYWYKDQSLVEIDERDLLDWVDQQLASWDDSGSHSSESDDVRD